LSEEDVVKKVLDLMATLDEVKKYKELAYALIDFVAIIVVSVIVVLGLLIASSTYNVVYPTTTGLVSSLLGLPASNPSLALAVILIPLAGLVSGLLWVDRRVKRVKVGEWKDTLREGVPGAVKVLAGLDWDSVLLSVRLSRVSFLLFALVKVAGYTLLAALLLGFFGNIFGGFLGVFMSPVYLAFLSLVLVLLFTSRSIVEGFRRLMSLDTLFWDLRVFSSDFKREFSKA